MIIYIKWLLKWLLGIFNNLNKNGKVLDLVPYFLSYKIIFDKRSNNFHKFKLRNIESDFYTFEQCIIYNSISLDNIAQGKALHDYYYKLINNKKIPIIIDCGSNIGLNTYHLSILFPKSIVISIEPDPNNYKIATYNTRNLNNVLLMNVAVSSIYQNLEIINKNSSPNSFITKPKVDGDVIAYTINEILSINKLSLMNVLLVKIDIEGFEKDLFSANIEWIDNTPLIIIEPHDWLLPWNSGMSSFLKNKSDRFDLVIQGEYLLFYNHLLNPSNHNYPI